MNILIRMQTMQWLMWVLTAVSFILLVTCTARLMRWAYAQRRKRALTSRRVLTGNEQEFYGRLLTAFPDYDIWPQVAMAALIDTTLDPSHPDYWAVRRQFSQKIVDYVILVRGAREVFAVIELDDRTHDERKDAQRDALLASVGIRTVRFQSTAKPEPAEIRRQVLGGRDSR